MCVQFKKRDLNKLLNDIWVSGVIVWNPTDLRFNLWWIYKLAWVSHNIRLYFSTYITIQTDPKNYSSNSIKK